MAKKSWLQHNNKIFNDKIEKHKQKLQSKVQQMFGALAREIVEYIEAFGEIEGMPYFTANLADGTGVGVYLNGQLMAYMPAPNATEPQEFRGIENIWGTEYLFDALDAGSTTYNKGVWVVLFSTVPYAVLVDDFGTTRNDGSISTPAGYFSEKLKTEMLNTFKIAFAREFPNVAKQMTSI